MPIASLIAKFRPEFEEHIEAARARSELATVTPSPEPAAVMSDTEGPLSAAAS
jgi:hypothetical protein